MTELDDDTRLRLDAIVETIARIACGDFAARLPISPARDEIDSVNVGLNMLAEDFAAERARRELAEERLRDAVDTYDSAPEMFCSVDPEGTVLQCNGTMARWLGLSIDAIVGQPLARLYPPADAGRIREAIDALIEGRPAATQDHELVRADGRTLTTMLSGSVRRDERGHPTRIRLLYRDVTESRRLEGALVQAQKMEGIGRLAGGIAHDFNNLLMAIFASTALLRSQLEGEDERENLEMIEQAAQRAAELTQHLLAFSRRSTFAPVATHLDDLIERMRKLLERTLGRNVEIVTLRARNPWLVMVDQTRIEQVVMNLAVNARDAMPEGGRLTLATRNETVREGDDESGLAPGEYVVLVVADEGVGMSDEVLDHLFEPFFTTKEPGKGTGLGLSTVYGIVRQAGGQVTVRSQLGRGTTFEVFLPRARAATAVVRAGARVESADPTTVRVLFVEDDAIVRALVHRALRDAGFQVLLAEDGRAALGLVEDARTSLDLVITDVMMPGLGGRELVQRLREGGIDAPVLFISGYTSDPTVMQRASDGSTDFLAKPFTTATLLARARALLGRPRVA